MKKTYTVLERSYRATLKKIGASLGLPQKSITSQTLPHFLEKYSHNRLEPSRIWIISGISGSGKTTISKVLDEAGFRKLPNVTTRNRRKEENDTDYVFTDTKTFIAWRKKNLLLHPHKRNAVWHAILKKDFQNLKNKNSRIYMDKSIASSLVLLKALPKQIRVTFVYLLAPSFRDLYQRISSREAVRARQGEKSLSKTEIFDRFEEEIEDMRKTIRLPYAYLVNDSPERIRKMIRKLAKKSQP